MMFHCVRWCVVPLVAWATATVDASDFFFQDGDVVVMIGDSITEQHQYSNFVEVWTVTRFPKWKFTFRNIGLAGDRSTGGNARFAKDVLRYKPTAMTVDFGMNDGNYQPFHETVFNTYIGGLQGIADQAKSANLRVAWVTPQPMDTADQGATALTGYNQTLEKYSEGVKQIAERNGALFVDQFHPYLKVLDEVRQKSPKYERITAGDAIHPGPPGQVLMAASILKGLSFPSLVSSAELDTEGKIVTTKNCSIENVVAKDGGLSFSRLDGGLPFFPAEAASMLLWSPVLDELNDYRLKVLGLTEGKYEIYVGGTKICEVTAEQLGSGVNLAAAALATGPIADHARLVRSAVDAKNKYHHDMIYRGVILNVPSWIYEAFPREEVDKRKNAIIDERFTKLAAMEVEVAKALEMKANTFEIVPVK